MLTNNQRILETQTFIVIPALALNQPRMTHKAVGGPSEQLRNITLKLHLSRISWFSGANARYAHLCLLLLSGPAQEARQKEFEQERLSSFADCLEHFME